MIIFLIHNVQFFFMKMNCFCVLTERGGFQSSKKVNELTNVLGETVHLDQIKSLCIKDLKQSSLTIGIIYIYQEGKIKLLVIIQSWRLDSVLASNLQLLRTLQDEKFWIIVFKVEDFFSRVNQKRKKTFFITILLQQIIRILVFLSKGS